MSGREGDGWIPTGVPAGVEGGCQCDGCRSMREKAALEEAQEAERAGRFQTWKQGMDAMAEREGIADEGDLRQELSAWWARAAEQEIGMVVDKAIEYSSVDLQIVGYGLLMGMGVDPTAATPEVCAQAGVAFYIQGKVGRMLGALAQGRAPSGDTWLDTGVYARMAQRIQETGGWPGEAKGVGS